MEFVWFLVVFAVYLVCQEVFWGRGLLLLVV